MSIYIKSDTSMSVNYQQINKHRQLNYFLIFPPYKHLIIIPSTIKFALFYLPSSKTSVPPKLQVIIGFRNQSTVKPYVCCYGILPFK